jgi:anti-anti-sigma factor
MEVQRLERLRDVAVVGVEGEIDHATARSFQHSVFALLAAEDRHLVLDFSDVAFWDSSGLRALVMVAQHLGRAGGRLVVVGAAKMQRLIEMTGLDGLISTAPSADAGLAALAETPVPG